MNASCAAEPLVPAEPSLLGPREEQRWLLQYLPLVKRIVSQLSLQASPALDREDMEPIGQPDDGFARFAGLRVRGAILDELRRQDWRPRGVRQQTHKLRDAVRELTRSLGREPTDEEILAHTGLSEEAYQGYLVDLSCEAIESLDGLLQAGQEGRFGDNGFEEQVQRERLLAQVLGRLPEREQLVLTLYYQHELSLKEIALVLELSDARICQLIKQAIQRACALLNEPN